MNFFFNHTGNISCFTCAWPKIISFPPEYVGNRRSLIFGKYNIFSSLKCYLRQELKIEKIKPAYSSSS